MSKHTPGPWVYAREYGESVTEAPKITTVARCADFVIGLECDYPGGDYRNGDHSGDEEADARLIAAAPDLLEACRAMLDCCYDMDRNDETLAAVKATMKAIAKATGEIK